MKETQNRNVPAGPGLISCTAGYLRNCRSDDKEEVSVQVDNDGATMDMNGQGGESSSSSSSGDDSMEHDKGTVSAGVTDAMDVDASSRLAGPDAEGFTLVQRGRRRRKP
jgi:hypothetical protein